MGSYRVKAIFGPTLQGEGLHAGMPCLFLRLAGCNAWDGRPETRARSSCPYCDTDFLGGEALDAPGILARLAALPRPVSAPTARPIGLVLSGGEPLLQADRELLFALGAAYPWVDVETNGTRACPPRPENVFISCSPKRIPGAEVVVEPDWWKVLIPDQQGFLARALTGTVPVFVQPTCPDGGPSGQTYHRNLAACLALCYRHGCRLSLQSHKYLGIE